MAPQAKPKNRSTVSTPERARDWRSWSSALLLFGAVQLTMLAAAFRGGERFGPRRWAGFVLAVGGMGPMQIRRHHPANHTMIERKCPEVLGQHNDRITLALIRTERARWHDFAWLKPQRLAPVVEAGNKAVIAHRLALYWKTAEKLSPFRCRIRHDGDARAVLRCRGKLICARALDRPEYWREED